MAGGGFANGGKAVMSSNVGAVAERKSVVVGGKGEWQPLVWSSFDVGRLGPCVLLQYTVFTFLSIVQCSILVLLVSSASI